MASCATSCNRFLRKNYSLLVMYILMTVFLMTTLQYGCVDAFMPTCIESTHVQSSRSFQPPLTSDACRPNNLVLQSHSASEESIRQMAADALVPVFYPTATRDSTSDIKNDGNLKNMQLRTLLDPEKALKKGLRRYQKNLSSLNTTATERQESRKLLADLVLGTSIMRLRHYHTLQSLLESNPEGELEHFGLSMKDIEPIKGISGIIRGVEIDKMGNVRRRTKVVRAMVDIHSEHINTRNLKQLGFKNKSRSVESLMKYIEKKGTAERISILYSLPIFFVDMLIEQYGEAKAEEMAIVFNRPGPITIRRNGIKCSSDELLCERLSKDHFITAIPMDVSQLGESKSNWPSFSSEGCIRLKIDDLWSPSKTSIWSLDAWKDGWFEVQDAGSQLIVKATEAESGDIVVDYCAGNGGKTFALASQMYGKNERGKSSMIIAHDIVEERLRQLKGSFERIGLASNDSIPTSSHVDVITTLDPGTIMKEKMADVVLIDAPCSSTGVLRRRPSQRFKLDKNQILDDFPHLQLSILKKGAELVKVGGRLVYATCSISHFENEDVVEAFESSDGFAAKWDRWHFDGLEEISSGHCHSIIPSVNGSDGFFIARWKRKSDKLL